MNKTSINITIIGITYIGAMWAMISLDEANKKEEIKQLRNLDLIEAYKICRLENTHKFCNKLVRL